jgi:hypothetical protein
MSVHLVGLVWNAFPVPFSFFFWLFAFCKSNFWKGSNRSIQGLREKDLLGSKSSLVALSQETLLKKRQ